MKKLLSILTLLVVAVTGAWANQTSLITGVTLPDVPTGTIDVSDNAVTKDANGWYVLMSPKTNLTSSFAWYKGIGTNGGNAEFTIPEGTVAPYPSGSQSINRYTLRNNGRSHAIRFTGVETASFLGNYSSDDRKTHVSLFSYDGVTQTLVGTKSVGSGIGELVFDGLSKSTNYIAYIYSNSGSNTDFYGFALKAPVATGLSIKTQPQSAEYSIGATATALTVVAQNGEEPYTYQWYSCSDAKKTNPQAVGTNASYTPSTAAVGTFYYYCKVTDSATPTPAEVESNVATITVNPKSNACKLYEAKYSNGFNAFINEGEKTVTVYYMAGGDAPTVTGTPDVSANATYDVSDPTKIVVTAEDGTTKATYAVTRTAVTPYNGDGVEFDGSETWIKTGNAYVTTTGTGDNVKTYYAWVINRQLKDSENRDDDARVALGKTRIYFFVDGAHSIRLYNEKGSSLSYDRKIKVYVNGELQESPTSMGAWKSDTKPSITIAAGNVPAMIEISSDQNSGDTGWGRIEVIKNKAVEVTDAKWATTTTPNWPVSFDENANVYVVTSIGGSIQLTQIAEAPANTPVIVNAAAGSYTMTPKSEAAAIATNLLTSATGTETGNGAGNYYVLGKNPSNVVGFGPLANGVTLTKGKAYIDGGEFVDAKDFLPFVIGDEENETTSINSIENGESRIENYDYFNLSGQRVGKDYKGIVIVNGKKVIRK